MTRLSKIGYVGTLIALATSLAFAQAPSPTASQALEVTAPRPRFDVAALCPAIHDQLPDALIRVYNDSAARGSVDVLMTVHGTSIGSVQTLEGPSVLQRAVRRALRLNVECATAEPVPQHVAFRVVFADAPASKAAIAPYPALLVAVRR